MERKEVDIQILIEKGDFIVVSLAVLCNRLSKPCGNASTDYYCSKRCCLYTNV